MDFDFKEGEAYLLDTIRYYLLYYNNSIRYYLTWSSMLLSVQRTSPEEEYFRTNPRLLAMNPVTYLAFWCLKLLVFKLKSFFWESFKLNCFEVLRLWTLDSVRVKKTENRQSDTCCRRSQSWCQWACTRIARLGKEVQMVTMTSSVKAVIDILQTVSVNLWIFRMDSVPTTYNSYWWR